MKIGSVTVGPDCQTREAREEVGERHTLDAEEAGQADLGKERRLGHPDARLGGDEAILGLADVRPPLEKRRWQAGRHGRREGLPGEGPAAADTARVATEQDAEPVLGLRDLPL